MTFEITFPDFSPINDDFMVTTKLLKDANKEDAKSMDPDNPLKIDSRKLCTGDWIILAKDQMTKVWLLDFFVTEKFRSQFIATPIS